MDDERAVPGLTFRPFRGPDDLPALVAVHRSREARDGVDLRSEQQRTPDVEELAGLFAPRDGFDPAQQLRLAEVDNRVIGYAWLRAYVESDSAWTCYHRTLLAPEWRGRGIGTALLRWAEARLTDFAAARPPGVRAVLRSSATEREHETVVRLTRAGYTVENAMVEMVLDNLDAVAPVSMPRLMTIRPLLPSEITAAYMAHQLALDPTWTATDVEQAKFDGFMAEAGTDPRLWRIATDSRAVCGVVMGEMGRFAGMIAELSVRPEWRRQGLGAALLRAGLIALRDRGATEARLYTDAADPHGARGLYERAGFRVLTTYLRFAKPVGG